MPPEGSTRAGILPGCPSLDRGSREAEVGFEPRTFRSVNSRSNHLSHLALTQGCFPETSRSYQMIYGTAVSHSKSILHLPSFRFPPELSVFPRLFTIWRLRTIDLDDTQWSFGRIGKVDKTVVRGSNPTSASRLPLSRLGQPDSIPALVLPLGSMAPKGFLTKYMENHADENQEGKRIPSQCV
ncbi:hypothetical protein CSKR_112268 [Clonorchis sinensis]|uniref:Uncharacterized protein n=1 Tax=Clonorchis sinensis TaxID=79923 RepID=A0A3R7DJ82_CLOSI|nr:hypothetical protein CSKR_112268 [Clonorchis sinensis]